LNRPAPPSEAESAVPGPRDAAGHIRFGLSTSAIHAERDKDWAVPGFLAHPPQPGLLKTLDNVEFRSRNGRRWSAPNWNRWAACRRGRY